MRGKDHAIFFWILGFLLSIGSATVHCAWDDSSAAKFFSVFWALWALGSYCKAVSIEIVGAIQSKK